MSKQVNNAVWITLMYEMQKFVRERLERPEFMADLRRRMSSEELLRSNHLLDVAKPEITRAMELLVPGMLTDFLASNPEILDQSALRRWAEEKD